MSLLLKTEVVSVKNFTNNVINVFHIHVHLDTVYIDTTELLIFINFINLANW